MSLVVPLRVGSIDVLALLDTGASHTLLSEGAFEQAEAEISWNQVPITLSTRLGPIECEEYRGRIVIPAEEGVDLVIDDGRMLVSPGWKGPTIIGWRGALEAMRFAVHPQRDDTADVYFAPS